jgi:hypothetical protein
MENHKGRNKLILLTVLWAMGVGLLCSGLAMAQVDTGEILGTVRDISHAVVPGTQVMLINQHTGFTLTTTTNGDGIYVFAPIKIGTYTVEVSKTGFEKVSHANIVVSIGAQVKVDFTLTPGRITQTVEVTTASPQLQTQSASTGLVVNTRQVNNFPLVTRNYTFLAQLSPGVTGIPPTRGMNQTGSFSANGTNTALNNYILDGIDNNNDSVDFLNGASYVALPPPDALSEFKVQTSDFDAQYGRAGGAVINATINSGTNQIHGDVWEYMQNSATDANGYFENATKTAIPKLTYNQFGFTIGGPVVIPHIYNGRNKTFFFGDFQGTREATADFEEGTVPTPLEVSSGYTNFQDTFPATTETVTDDLGRTFNADAIFDPATTRAVTAGQVDPVTGLTATQTGYVRDPFYEGSLVGVTNFGSPAQEQLMNILPAGRLDSNAIKLLQLYPAANTTGIANGTEDNFVTTRASPNSINHFDLRGDQDFSAKDQMFGVVSYDNQAEYIPGTFVGIGADTTFGQGNISNFDLNAALSETHIFSPTLVNELRLGYSRLYSNYDAVLVDQPGIPAMFGIQGIPQTPDNYGLPAIDVEGIPTNTGYASSLGASEWSSPNNRTTNTFQISENLTLVHGKHTLKGGFETQLITFPWEDAEASRGYFTFGTYTGIPDVTSSNDPLGMADLLLTPIASTAPGGINYVGGPDSIYDTNAYLDYEDRHYYGAYFQDSYKVLPKVTLNLGLRWEFYGAENVPSGYNAILEPGEYCAVNKECDSKYVLNSKLKSVPLSPSFTSLLAKDGIGLQYSSVPGLVNTPLTDFAPRTGLAWQVTHKLVARLGYGIYFAGFQNIGSPDQGYNYPANVGLSNPPTTPETPITYANGQTATLETGLLDQEPTPTSPSFTAEGLSLYAYQNPWKTGYMQEWNVTLQYQLTPNQTVTVGYMGNDSHHLETGANVNLPSEIIPPGTSLTNGCPGKTSCVPFPDFGTGASFVSPEGNGYYNALEAEWQRRFSGGLQTLVDYTYSRCMSDFSQLLGLDSTASVRADTVTGFGGIEPDYALCASDSPNIFHGSAIWQLPFGRGERFGRNVPKVANLLAGGWQAQTIVTLQNGFPFGNVGCPISTNGIGSCDALLVPGQSIYEHKGPGPGITSFLNPAAFRQPPIDTTFNDNDFAVFGGSETPGLGPSYDDVDFSMFKSFQTSERTRLEFRAEFFNFFNTPHFAEPGNLGNFEDTEIFSNITSTLPNNLTGTDVGRMIQFALKFYW